MKIQSTAGGLLGLVLALTASTAFAQLPFLGITDANGKPTLAPLLKEVTPAVVSITVEAQVQQQANPLFNDPLFQQFFGFQGPQGQPQPQPRIGAGSGVIIDAANGYVLTNHHVIDGADKVTVTLADGRSVDAKVIGSDEGTDIALLDIDAPNLKALRLGDSDSLQVGDFVLAIGNPFGLGQTVTSGIVSALGRSGLNIEGYEDFIQTDASINPGNSGGALVDLDGQLVGINSAIIAPSGGNVGIGFAVPANMAGKVMDQLLEYGEVQRGRLGVMIGDVTPDVAEALNVEIDHGAYVSEVEPGSAAEKAGIEPGDVIVEFNGESIDSYTDLKNAVGLLRIGSTVDVTLIRDGQRKSVEATIGESEGTFAAAGGESGRTIEKLQGAEFRTLDPRDPQYGKIEGVLVTNVDENSPAYRNGLRTGDIITAINRQPVTTADDLARVVNRSTGAFGVFLVRDNRRVFLAIQ
jgi:serine protease DegQ